MNRSKILVTGATGNIGGKVANILVQNGCSVRVTGRNTEKLKPYHNKAEVLNGDLEDERFLKTVLARTKAMFLVLPALRNTTIESFAFNILKLAEEAGISHIVNISNCTLSRHGNPTPHIEFEYCLNQSSGMHIKHLRCANFFENLNWGIHTPYKPDIKLPYISSREVAHIAAGYLQELNFEGSSVDELMGKQDYSMSDFAEMLGVTYRQLTPAPWDASFFDAFNSAAYTIVKRNDNNTSKSTNALFSLEYFLAHDFNRELLNN